MSTTHESLLAEYEALEDNIEDSASAQMWTLAKWLRDNVPNAQGERSDLATGVAKLTIADLAARDRRSAAQLKNMRQVATAFGEPVGVTVRYGREVPISVRTHLAALRNASGDVDAARAAIAEKGPGMRAHTGSLSQDKAAAKRLLSHPETAAELMADKDVREAAIDAAFAAAEKEIAPEVDEQSKAERRRIEAEHDARWEQLVSGFDLALGVPAWMKQMHDLAEKVKASLQVSAKYPPQKMGVAALDELREARDRVGKDAAELMDGFDVLIDAAEKVVSS